MKNVSKKVIPIIITVIALVYMLFFAVVFLVADGLGAVAMIGIIAVSLLAGALVVNLHSRLKEIDEIDEDELKKF